MSLLFLLIPLLTISQDMPTECPPSKMVHFEKMGDTVKMVVDLYEEHWTQSESGYIRECKKKTQIAYFAGATQLMTIRPTDGDKTARSKEEFWYQGINDPEQASYAETSEYPTKDKKPEKKK